MCWIPVYVGFRSFDQLYPGTQSASPEFLSILDIWRKDDFMETWAFMTGQDLRARVIACAQIHDLMGVVACNALFPPSFCSFPFSPFFFSFLPRLSGIPNPCLISRRLVEASPKPTFIRCHVFSFFPLSFPFSFPHRALAQWDKTRPSRFETSKNIPTSSGISK